LVADPARCRMLLALDDCRALPACGLAAGRDLLSEPFALPPPGAHPAEAC
jgi:hypothetical protein